MTQMIAVAVSGGVDSLYSAYRLVQDGYHVSGLHFVTGFEKTDDPSSDPMAWGRHVADAIASQLNIDVHVVDLRHEFKSTVVNYFIREYESGRTPNPCMACNPAIKFGHLLTVAQQHGAHGLATGHYARITTHPSTGRFELRTGIDSQKDQSYFLARLDQDQLARTVFPLGEYTKDSVKKAASQVGLSPLTGKESQDICFLPEGHYRQFLARHSAISQEAGPIEHVDGRMLGQHLGLYRYTVGQRRGIDIPADRPYYVVALDTPNNRLIVGDRKALEARECHVTDINWIAEPPSNMFVADVRIRYRSPAASATITPGKDGHAAICFMEPQTAITPGQGAVFYDGDRVLGGGWIRGAVSSS